MNRSPAIPTGAAPTGPKSAASCRSNSPKNYSILQAGIGGGPYSDNTIAPNNGDIYFLSPERLAGNNGVDGQENLFVYHGGKLKFIAALEPSGVACLEQQCEIVLQRSPPSLACRQPQTTNTWRS